jgi:PEP-CTERM/exosortase A-associated glycosyltransferase
MKALHVLDQSAPIVAGYTSRARSILAGQAEVGIAPVALTGVRQGASREAHDGAHAVSSAPSPSPFESIDGVRIYRTNPIRGADRVRVAGAGEALEMAALARRIVDVAAVETPDIIHAHSPVLCGLPGHAAARWRRAASVYEIRAFWEDAAVNAGRLREGSPKYRAIRALETWLARTSDALVVLCEGIRRDVLDRGVPNERIFTVPNGVDAERFVPAPRDMRLAAELGLENKTVIGYIGTLFRFEGIPLLLESLARLTREDDSVRGLVVGHGETYAELRTLHASLGLGDRVIVTGPVPPRDVARYYTLVDVLCYPRESHRITELTTPLKPLEAMSMGKAVVGSSVGGLRELITDGKTGILFRAGDAEDLGRVLRRLVADPLLRHELGDRARRYILAERDWTRLARRYVDVYSAAIEYRRSRARSALSAVG